MTRTENIKELLSIYKDLTSYQFGNTTNYYYLLNEIYEIKQNKKIEDKILFFFRLMLNLIGLIFTCPQQYELFDKYLNDSTVNRNENEIMGSNFGRNFIESSKRKKSKQNKSISYRKHLSRLHQIAKIFAKSNANQL